jgi:hypothetical protein
MKKLKEYTVFWENTVFASSREDAAKQCHKQIVLEETYFDVSKGNISYPDYDYSKSKIIKV